MVRLPMKNRNDSCAGQLPKDGAQGRRHLADAGEKSEERQA